VEHFHLAAADAGALFEMLEVLFESLLLLGRAQLEKEGLELGEKRTDLFTRDQLEDAELMEFRGRVVDELGGGHGAGTADLVAEPGLDLVGDDLDGDAEEL
jgi:hypothetical protein